MKFHEYDENQWTMNDTIHDILVIIPTRFVQGLSAGSTQTFELIQQHLTIVLSHFLNSWHIY